MEIITQPVMTDKPIWFVNLNVLNETHTEVKTYTLEKNIIETIILNTTNKDDILRFLGVIELPPGVAYLTGLF